MTINYLSETDVAKILTPDIARSAVEDVFRMVYLGEARSFPVVREEIAEPKAIFGIKSGVAKGLGLGLKAGGYWTGNVHKGLTNHQSTILLFDPETGRPISLVEGNLITALRTGAACASAIDHLAPKEGKILSIIGAGFQAPYHLRAALATRQFTHVFAWNRTPGKIESLRKIAEESGVEFSAPGLEETVRVADVLITIISSSTAIFDASWVKPGAHISCMGTDTAGKQELQQTIFANARVFTDDIIQSTTIGETQHAIKDGILNKADIQLLGAVLTGSCPARRSREEITIFDGTGIALQDIACAQRVFDAVQR